MANRSDFYSAKLPRYLKRMITMGEAAGHYGKQEANDMRKSFINAHANHINFKLKRNAAETRDTAEVE